MPLYRPVTPAMLAPRHNLALPTAQPPRVHTARGSRANMAAARLGHGPLLLLLLWAGLACRTSALTVMSDYEDGFATFYGASERDYAPHKA